MKHAVKKALLTLVSTVMLAIPNAHLVADGGDAAVGVAAGLGIGMLGIAASRSGSGRARRAEEEARRAQDQSAAVRREHQQTRMMDIQRQMSQQHMTYQSSRTFNILIFAVIFLFLAVLGLAFMLFKQR